ncbi:hypothetical protein ACJRO7_020955 [Eucalyptus globulus]|uniref:At1g61320/AtMIF1 LRR domain-containing protein n=1 Tax=Eucalyptus globulus TaxID=34317 RepID=A0ABD3KJV1_EUCGL
MLIHRIFSFLLTGEVVKTCVLSKRWQFIGTTISDLRFFVDSSNDSIVGRVLKLYGWHKVKKFHLDIRPEYFHPSKIDSWVRFATDHQVEELLLNLNWGADYKLSPLFYNCSSFTELWACLARLLGLCLTGCRFLSNESINWSLLKSLSIQDMYASGDVLRKILMDSPILEYLKLERCWDLVIDNVIVQLRSEIFASPLEIWTPHLLLLHVRGIFYEMIRILEASSLVEPKLDFDAYKLDCSLLNESLCKLQNATRIQLHAWCLSVSFLRTSFRQSVKIFIGYIYETLHENKMCRFVMYLGKKELVLAI